MCCPYICIASAQVPSTALILHRMLQQVACPAPWAVQLQALVQLPRSNANVSPWGSDGVVPIRLLQCMHASRALQYRCPMYGDCDNSWRLQSVAPPHAVAHSMTELSVHTAAH